MLGQLIKYANDHDLSPEPGFKTKYIRWAIVLTDTGDFLDVLELGNVDIRKNPGLKFPKCPDLSQPELISGSETRSHFLVDTADVVLLFGKNKDDPKILSKHEYFIKLLTKASSNIPQLQLIVKAITNNDILNEIGNRLEIMRAKNNDKVTFKVGNDYILNLDCWHNWWRQHRLNISTSKKRPGKKEKTKEMVCYVTGELSEPVATHSKINGLADVGGQPSGDVLIGFDKDAFRSYSLTQSLNAAVSENAMCAYRDALNDLIRNSGYRLAGTKIVHWFKNIVPPEDDPLSWLIESEDIQKRNAQQRANELLKSIKIGKRPDLANNHYYALTMSGAAGRIMIRDWMDGQFIALLQNINSWYDDLSIVNRDGSGLAPLPKFYAILGSTVRDLDELVSPFVSKLWHIAIHNEIISLSALSFALHRMRSDIFDDKPFNHARMGLMKAYNIRKRRTSGGDSMKQDLKPYLNEDHPDPAYHCGRLMAVLAFLQRAALGDVGAGVVQRYYAAVSSTPSLVMGRLIRMAQFHLSKLEGGLPHWYEEKISGISCKLKDNLPNSLSLEKQSLFALGYYQQIADLRTKKKDNSINSEV